MPDDDLTAALLRAYMSAGPCVEVSILAVARVALERAAEVARKVKERADGEGEPGALLAAEEIEAALGARKEAEEAVKPAEYTNEALGALAFDFLNAKADAWMADVDVQHMFNAIASVFEKWAPQDIMDRFRQKLGEIGHQCFVEGALRTWSEIAAERRAANDPLPTPPGGIKP